MHRRFIFLSYQVFKCWRLHKWEQLDLKPLMKRGIFQFCGGNWQHNSSVGIATERTSEADTKMNFGWSKYRHRCQFTLSDVEIVKYCTLVYCMWTHPLTSRFHLCGSWGFSVGVAQQSSNSSTKSSSSCLRANTSTYTDWPSSVKVWGFREE